MEIRNQNVQFVAVRKTHLFLQRVDLQFVQPIREQLAAQLGGGEAVGDRFVPLDRRFCCRPGSEWKIGLKASGKHSLFSRCDHFLFIVHETARPIVGLLSRPLFPRSLLKVLPIRRLVRVRNEERIGEKLAGGLLDDRRFSARHEEHLDVRQKAAEERVDHSARTSQLLVRLVEHNEAEGFGGCKRERSERRTKQNEPNCGESTNFSTRCTVPITTCTPPPSIARN